MSDCMLTCKVALRNGHVPRNFVPTLLRSYRKHRETGNVEDKKAFYYFVSRILSQVNPKQTRFEKDKGRKVLSNMFTVTDEAFAIMVVENYDQRWRKQHVEPDKKKWHSDEMNAKYTSSRNGKRKNTWTKEGMQRYHEWCAIVAARRGREEYGKDLEEELMSHYNKDEPATIRAQQSDGEEENCDEPTFTDSQFNAFFAYNDDNNDDEDSNEERNVTRVAI